VALENAVITALGRVVHVTEVLNGTFETGVEFLEISGDDIERIRRYVATRSS